MWTCSSRQPFHYGEVLTARLRAIRPELAAFGISPEQLDTTVYELRPRMVVCSNASAREMYCSPIWVVMYPDERDEAHLFAEGITRTIEHVTVERLFEAFDALTQSPMTGVGESRHPDSEAVLDITIPDQASAPSSEAP